MLNSSVDNFRNRVIVIAQQDIDLRVLFALKYARTISDDVTLFGVVACNEEERNLKMSWEKKMTGIPIVLRCSPDGEIVDHLLDFIRSGEYGFANDEMVTVILQRLVAKKWSHGLMHDRAGDFIERRLSKQDRIVTVILPFHLDDDVLTHVFAVSGL